MSIWSELRHPNILPFLGLARLDELGPCFVSPWMMHGDVLSYLKEYPTMDRVRIIRGVIQGITYLHTQKRPVIHGDIKGLNILISSEGFPVLCDFGLSILLDPDVDRATTTTAALGSQRYMAPERLLPRRYNLSMHQSRTPAADMFSFAITAFEILTSIIPFVGISGFNAGMEIVNGRRPDIPEVYYNNPAHKNLIESITGCWCERREERLTAVQVLELLG
ncbi:kinase-like protein [Dacryopinax primogenitus]|uniref:Kinase-like protein n=1 Tax=Dacryopinax primogenitus (strain DJM 731) TaxID=1858805 RepID=M5FTV5_DACPD|nr:kinase-like protein [Dacryopinax primogenitus]EJU01096.1 kinase-like protein [Dacryopinax primogenitus]